LQHQQNVLCHRPVNLTDHLEEVMQSAVDEGFAGVVLVGQDNRIILDFAYGSARRSCRQTQAGLVRTLAR
jgi:hypothetical protein